MMFRRPRVVIAGLKGGSGKTTFSLGLLNLWKKNGYRVIPFKKGPDYIDAGWLAAASGNNCYNLDAFIIPEKALINSFLQHSANSDAALIEGNRGLYDGMDSKGTFSTANLSKLIDSPVILMIDCTKATTTIGVIVKGVKEFDKTVSLQGVILNNIANHRHESVIREAVENFSDIPVLGAIRKQREKIVFERHMGLVSNGEFLGVEGKLIEISGIINDSVDVDKIWQVMLSTPEMEYQGKSVEFDKKGPKVKIGIIKDNAFQFYYPENFEQLQYNGAEIINISAINQNALPEIDALYIGGGFPETYAINLSENDIFRRSLKIAIEEGLPVYAECGGLMFLGRSISYEGRRFPMVNIFPIDFIMEKRPQAHGYTVVEVYNDNPFYPKDVIIKGHEFHYSSVDKLDMSKMNFVFRMNRGKGIANGLDGAVYKNVLATYTHIHALGVSEWVEGLIKAARRFKNEQSHNKTIKEEY